MRAQTTPKQENRFRSGKPNRQQPNNAQAKQPNNYQSQPKVARKLTDQQLVQQLACQEGTYRPVNNSGWSDWELSKTTTRGDPVRPSMPPKNAPIMVSSSKKTGINGMATGSGSRGMRAPANTSTFQTQGFQNSTYVPPTGKEIISAQDRMQEAKLNPGQESAPYVAGDNVLPTPTGACTVGNSFVDCPALDPTNGSIGGSFAIGTSAYTVIMQCNAMTVYHGPGGTSPAGVVYHQPTTKLGGMVIVQCDPASVDTPWIRQDLFAELNPSLSMSEFFRSDFGGFSNGGLVWAQETNFMEFIPMAMRVCPRWKLNLLFGQLPTGDMGAGLTLNQVIGMSTSLKETDKPYLKTCIVNNQLAAFSQNPNRASLEVPPFAYEIVNIVIIQTPSMSLTTGTPTPFTLGVTISFNFLFWPQAEDAVANNIFKRNTIKDQSPIAHSALPHATEGIQPQDVTDVPSTRGGDFRHRLGGFFKKAGSRLWDRAKAEGRDMIGNAAMALLATDFANPYYVKADLLVQLDRCLRSLKGLCELPGVQAVYDLLFELRRVCREVSGRIVDVTALLPELTVGQLNPQVECPLDFALPDGPRPSRTPIVDPKPYFEKKRRVKANSRIRDKSPSISRQRTASVVKTLPTGIELINCTLDTVDGDEGLTNVTDMSKSALLDLLKQKDEDDRQKAASSRPTFGRGKAPNRFMTLSRNDAVTELMRRFNDRQLFQRFLEHQLTTVHGTRDLESFLLQDSKRVIRKGVTHNQAWREDKRAVKIAHKPQPEESIEHQPTKQSKSSRRRARRRRHTRSETDLYTGGNATRTFSADLL